MNEEATNANALDEASAAFDHDPETQVSQEPTHIICIGASAGGLQPIEDIIRALRFGMPAAFVVVQHLSPDFKSLMDELLARLTTIPLRKVTDGMKVEANTIYLIPPRKEIRIEDNVLVLEDHDSDEPGPPLPINTFMKSLANDMGEKAIAVILSGSGTDGSEGAHAILNAGGRVFVQDPDTAAFDSMPESVIRSCPDCKVMSAAEIGNELVLLLPPDANGKALGSDGDLPAINRIMRALSQHYGLDLRYYKTSTVHRRIARRRELSKTPSLQSYADRVDKDAHEREHLYFDLLINVTGFFRDRDAFAALEHEVLPKLSQQWDETHPLRVWVPACATGEEAYSLAIALNETARKLGRNLEFNIFATDLHRKSLEFASAGVYTADSLGGLSNAQREQYFVRNGDYFQISPDLRRQIVFSRHDLLMDPPFTKMDLVSCRNLLIYFTQHAQRITLSRLHFALKKDAYLFLGQSETLGNLEPEFDIVSARWRIYRKRRDVRLGDLPLQGFEPSRPPPRVHARNRRPEKDNLAGSNYQGLLDKFVPDGFLVDRSGRLLHSFGIASHMLEFTEGRVTGSIEEFLPEHLRLPVSVGLQKASASNVAITVRAHNHGENEITSLTIDRIPNRNTTNENFFITIDTPKKIEETQSFDISSASQEEHVRRVRELELELSSSEETLQTMIEELQSSNEELQASNEELQSTNEELHSVNEELYTVTAEHQQKVNELTSLTYDMDNVLKSLTLPLVFLNEHMEIRRYTPLAENMFYFVPHDIGRSLNAIRTRFKLDTLEDDIRQVMKTRQPLSRTVIDHEGCKRLLRIQPYFTEPRICKGTILTFFKPDDFALDGDAGAVSVFQDEDCGNS